jgi:hypothetical protein
MLAWMMEGGSFRAGRLAWERNWEVVSMTFEAGVSEKIDMRGKYA